MTNYHNYLYTKQLDLNLDDMHNANVCMHDIIMKNFYNDTDGHAYSGAAAKTTKVYDRYNVFLYPYHAYYNLYNSIKNMFYEVAEPTEPHYMQAWLNVYESGEYIDWHGHWDAQFKAWHGFYCADVETESSHTLYKIPCTKDIIKINSVNNLLVLGKSENDKHKSSEWHSSHPRVTIAFDIIPLSKISESEMINHYIPI